MASSKMQALEAAGIDAQGALSRLMNNEGFYLRMLGKFVEDPTYTSLEAAYESKDMDALLHAAHALKGVSGNLGMVELSRLCEQMQHLLEGRGEGDVEGLMAGIRVAYLKDAAAAREAVG